MSNSLLLSGGIESTALAFWLRPALCITIDYGQITAAAEIEAAVSICALLDLSHVVLSSKITFLKHGLLAGEHLEGQEGEEFWPFRNQLLATIAAMAAYERGINTLIFGTVVHDQRFADGSASFFRNLNALLGLQPGAIRVETPAAKLTTEELIVSSRVPRNILGLTFSCHRGRFPCGDCPGCRKHSAVMKWVKDHSFPTVAN